VKVDLVYRHAGLDTAVLIDERDSTRPDPTDLVFAGWNVIKIRVDDELGDVVAANPAVFGQEQR